MKLQQIKKTCTNIMNVNIVNYIQTVLSYFVLYPSQSFHFQFHFMSISIVCNIVMVKALPKLPKPVNDGRIPTHHGMR